MRNGRPCVCYFVPPHILRNIADKGDAAQRDLAHAALEIADGVRAERRLVANFVSALSLSSSGKRRTVYDALHSKTLPGKLIRGESDKPTRDVAANEAFDGAGVTYDFYRNVLGRDSIDGRGMRLDSSVHFGQDYNNAQWNGRQMIYGDGDGKIFGRFTQAIDVIGHELTHGVTQHTAGLDYHDQSGALNEHFSDVVGSLVKQYSLKQTADKADWLLAAGLFTKAINGKAIRSLKAPGTAYDDKLLGKDPQPAHMKDFKKQTADAGGVHVNSGIPNHAFYLVAVALGGNSWDVAGKIWYETLTKRLTHDAQFQHCADATYAVAVDRYGATSNAARAVADGWAQVGLPIAAAASKLPIRRRAAGVIAEDVVVPAERAVNRAVKAIDKKIDVVRADAKKATAPKTPLQQIDVPDAGAELPAADMRTKTKRT
jgi:Zn-dependent metalloprotease